MLGFNWIDLIILLLLAGAFYGGLKIGLFTLLAVFGGFFGMMFLGGWLFPHIFPFHDRTLLTVVNGNLVLITSAFAAVKGYDVGQRLHYSLKGRWHYLESALGLTLSLGSCFVVVWLIGAALGRLPFVALSNTVNSSFVLQRLDRLMPPMPSFMAEFDKQIDPNAPPYLFLQPKPAASFNYSPADFEQAQAKGTPSVVRITSFGCGGVVSGSGFAVGRPGLVATSAHIIAGVKRPVVKYAGRSFEGVPVLFDPNLDLAVLRVAGLPAPALKLAASDQASGVTVSVLGFPNGNFTAEPGILRDNQVIFGRNIYGEGTLGRDIYEVQAFVEGGSSGGPVILPDGRAAGIVFSKSDASPDYAFALDSSHLIGVIGQAANSTHRVSTGVCLAGQ